MVSPLQKKLARQAREDVNLFTEFVFRVKQAKCHKRIQEHIHNNNRAGVIAHKELGKTTQAIAYILWRIGRDPNLLIKLVCSSDDAAKDRVMYLRDMIDRNPRLHMVFPDLRKSSTVDNWGKFSLTVERERFSKDASIEAHGVLTQAEGRRADIILFDDICDYQNTIKFPSYRPMVKQAFKVVWIPLLGPEGHAIYLATKHHEDDATCWLEKNKQWKWIDLSVTGDPPVSPWPEKWTTERLQRRLEEIGTIEFDRSYRNILHPDSERIIKEAWMPTYMASPPRSLVIVSWDFGAGGEKSDYTTYAHENANLAEKMIHVERVEQFRRLSFNAIIAKILEVHRIIKPHHHVVEHGGFQIIVGNDDSLLGLPIEKVVPTLSKEQRVRQTAVWYERKRISFKEDTTAEAREQIKNFPRTKHKDMCDAVTQGINWLTAKMGKPFNPEQATSKSSRQFGTSTNIGDSSSVSGRERVFSRERESVRGHYW